jgi:hypothetical protein
MVGIRIAVGIVSVAIQYTIVPIAIP